MFCLASSCDFSSAVSVSRIAECDQVSPAVGLELALGFEFRSAVRTE